MSTMKDKLANSVRQAKSGARPVAQSTRTATVAPEAPAMPAAPATPESAAAADIPAGKRASADAQSPTPSTKELFPRRVWPD